MMGGSAGFGSYIEGNRVGEVSLAGMLGYFGGILGIAGDFRSLNEFRKEYQEGRSGLKKLGGHIEETIGRFDTTINDLVKEKMNLEDQLEKGGC